MNTFYQESDYQRIEDTPKPQDYRSPFQTDRDRIIYTPAFRRLQAKTQVFLSGEYDFYRTRLTHSIEVAQIGRSICDFLKKTSNLLSENFFIEADLVEAVCLAHDLGHPPFGHAGERSLQGLLRGAFGGFEGNAQSLRIVTQLIYSSGDHKRGMNPTRAFLDGILKYKTLYSELDDPENHFIYSDQKSYIDFVNYDLPFPKTYFPGEARNHCRSVECQIMDWADDTAYSLNDIVDSVRAGFLTPDKIRQWGKNTAQNDLEETWLNDLLAALEKQRVESLFGRKIGNFITACRLEKNENFLSQKTNRHAFRLVIEESIKNESVFYKRLATDLVFRSQPIHQLEYKGNYILSQIFEMLRVNYTEKINGVLQLLPDSTHKRIKAEKEIHQKLRLLCDYLAGMTDGFALRTYKRLLTPEFNSITDLV